MDRKVAHHRQGFSLVELLVVVGIILILAAMTIGAIRLSVTTEVVRSGARQVQSLIEGSRDRAIYAGEARGIRLLVDDTDGSICTTIVYIGTSGAYESEPDASDSNLNGNQEEPPLFGAQDFNDIDGDGDTDELLPGGFLNVANPNPGAFPAATGPAPPIAQRILIGAGTDFAGLADRKLIRAGSHIRLGRDNIGQARNSTELLTLHPASFPIRTESYWFGSGGPLEVAAGFSADRNGNGWDDEVVFIATESSTIDQHGLGVTAPMLDGNWHFSLDTEADILPGEEPSILPRNCCIDLETSHLPPSWVVVNPDGSRQYSNRMDLLFAPGGAVVGPAASAGVIHLHVCHTQDAIDNVPPGSQTLDGLPNGEPRQGDEFGATIFTKSGRVNIHPIDWGSYPVPADEVANLSHPGYWQANTSYAVGDTVAPTLYDGNVYVVTEALASTGAAEPTWNSLAGGTTRDGGVKWRAGRHNVWRAGLSGELAR